MRTTTKKAQVSTPVPPLGTLTPHRRQNPPMHQVENPERGTQHPHVKCRKPHPSLSKQPPPSFEDPTCIRKHPCHLKTTPIPCNSPPGKSFTPFLLPPSLISTIYYYMCIFSLYICNIYIYIYIKFIVTSHKYLFQMDSIIQLL
jgi:hypothetical protein